MLFAFLAALALAPVSARALVGCPSGVPAIHVCAATPKPGDNDFIGRLFLAVFVCKEKDKYTLVADTGAARGDVMPAEAESHAGGSTYRWHDDYVRVEFSVATGLPPNVDAPGTLKLSFPRAGQTITGEASFTCAP